MQRTSIPTLHAEPITGHADQPTLFELIREQGGVPAIVLGRRAARQIVSLDPAEVELAVQGDEHPVVRIELAEVDLATQGVDHPVVRIELAAETFWARIADVARDLDGRKILHVEMTRLPRGEVVVVDVPVEVHRKSASRWAYAPLQKLESVRIEGPVERLPDVLEINAKRLRPHESITLGELKLPRYCEPVDLPLDTPVVTLLYYGERGQAEKETAPRTF